MKKYFAILLTTALLVGLAGCTSKDSEGDAPPEDTANLSLDDELGLDQSSDGGDAVAGTDEAAAGFLDDQLPEDSLGEKPTDSNAEVAQGEVPTDPMAEQAPSDQAAADQALLDGPLDQAPPSDQVALDAPPENIPPPEIEAPPAEIAGVDPGVVPPPEPPQTIEEPPPAPKPIAPLRKVEAAPLHRAGYLLNAVYIARPGDNYKKISQMIYGSDDQATALKKSNPWIKSPKPGDKIYYNSPQRPTDDSRMANFYEDMGVPPMTYVAKEGDNLRVVAKDLLGYPNAWKELWVTNPVESKTTLPEGTELRYWTGLPARTELAAAPSQMQEMPPPPPEMPPPPPMQEPAPMAAATTELPPPPPPPVEPPPPPPPPAPVAVKRPPVRETSMLDDDMTMAMAGAGVIIAGLAGLMIMRKRRAQREAQAAFGDTQVGT